LQHPNEFLRGSTLRFLCKLKEPELLEPLMPAIRACLEHRHSYVRRNAVLAIFTIYRYCFNVSFLSYCGYPFIIFILWSFKQAVKSSDIKVLITLLCGVLMLMSQFGWFLVMDAWNQSQDTHSDSGGYFEVCYLQRALQMNINW